MLYGARNDTAEASNMAVKSHSGVSPKRENVCWAQLQNICGLCPTYIPLEMLLTEYCTCSARQYSECFLDTWA